MTAPLVLLLAAAAQAGPQTWDLATFEPPSWESARSNDVLGFTQVDQAAGTFCQLQISDSQPSTGDAKADFLAEWKELVAAGRETERTPSPTAGRTPSGLSYLEGGAGVAQEGHRFYFQLFTFAAGARRMSVQVSSGDAQGEAGCRARLAPFFASLRVKGAPATPAAAVAAPAPGSGFRGPGLTGVWMGFKQDALIRYEPQANWVVFFDDGRFVQNLPNGGLLGLDRAASRARLANSWGTWAWKDGAGRMKKPGVAERFDVKMRSGKNGQLLLDDVPYFHCASVDGLRLAGAWTSWTDPDDAALDRQPLGARPILRFSKDGTFVDEGVFATLMRTGSAPPQSDAAGAGTYAIKDFSLTLRYSDGRVKQVAFNGFLGADPAGDDKSLYIERSLFRKRR